MSTQVAQGPVPVCQSPSQVSGLPTASQNDDTLDGHFDASKAGSGDVQVQLHYLKDEPLYHSVKPLQIVPEWRDVQGLTNVKLEAGPQETLHNVRGREREFTLDDHGFQYVHAPTTFTDWSSQPEIGRVHLPELEELLRREVEGADEILFYDARLRQETETGVKVSGLSYKPFARQVHTDNTESSVLSKIHNLTDMKADYYLQGRVRIINIWRPIKHPVYDCGLAVANGAKLREDDVLECDRVRADTGKFWDTMGVIKYREGFEWHYMALQDEPDVLLFKNYDSATNVKAPWCLHTAFDLPPDNIPPNAPTRESIEVRALVFTLPQGLRRPSTLGVMQHPLAQQLEQERLPLVDEDHCITDHPRTDIDEGGEMKDAMLMLRRKEMKRVQRVNEELKTELSVVKSELSQLNADLDAANTMIDIQQNHSAGLKDRVETDEKRSSQQLAHSTALQETVVALKSENGRLLDYIESQAREIEKWRADAEGRGNVAVSNIWQASVDEAVRREREKDGWTVKAKDEEIARLKEELEHLKESGVFDRWHGGKS